MILIISDNNSIVWIL